MFVLEVLGTLSLRGDRRPVPVAAQQKRPLGLLAILGIAGRQGRSRDRIEAYLWPESSGALARHSLDQTVYAIRHALGSDVILATGRELRLNPDAVQVDVWDFDDAIRAHEWEAAVGRYTGALLDGIHFGDSRELESWIDTERARLLGEYQGAVEALADIAADAGDHSQSVSWYRRLANSDPLSTRATKKLMLALAGAGDRAGAVKHARLYQGLVRQQLQMEPDAEIERLASTLSQPEKIDIVGAAARRPPESVAALLGADTEMPAPNESGLGETILRTLAPRNALPLKRWRISAILMSSILIVLLIGAVTIEKRQGRDRRSRLAGMTARSSATPMSAARGAYLHALDAWSDGSKEGLDSAVVYFSRATELDSEYAAAYAGLADAYVMLAYFGYRPSDMMFPRAKDAALRSMRLDSTLASAHPALAYELTWERDFVGADSEFRKAVAFDPTQVTAQAMAFDPAYATAHQWYGILLMILGQKPEAVAAVRRPAKEDPFSLHVPVTELTFTKWFDDYPAMEGFTSYGPGTIAGQVLSRIDDGVFTHLVARYEVTDPNGGTHSWKAVLQGKATNTTGIYDLNGIVTWGWMTGAQVHVNFQRITPCEFGKRNICFQGTIQIQRE
jgi:DNA-binding SARP family transcriptional activator